MLFINRLLGAPLVWNARGAAVPHSVRVRCCSTAVRMHLGDGAQAYAGIFAESPGITRAWSLPGEGSETLLVQRTARNIEGGGYSRHSVVREGGLLLYCC